jgi:hypothetical protein
VENISVPRFQITQEVFTFIGGDLFMKPLLHHLSFEVTVEHKESKPTVEQGSPNNFELQ